ncbi:hypothetical protein QJS10_CPA08g00748 [Acorus calamus]|uniref:Uncharacterized protein n=1 Tax=Acorus calamus TaxID=4465 RepID=A0AAV9EDE6_ACOCL|nr:hypothetical protein QJS10_CPA08g00748 [Acorus calamus]
MNRDLNLDLRVSEIMHTYELRKSSRGYHFRARNSKEKLTDGLPDSDKGWAETPSANSRLPKDLVKLEHIKAAFKRSERVFYRILGWDNPNPSSTHRLRSRLTDVYAVPPSPVQEIVLQAILVGRPFELEENSEEELEPLFRLGFSNPMATESSSSGARHGSRHCRGPRGSPKSGEKSSSHSAEKATPT